MLWLTLEVLLVLMELSLHMIIDIMLLLVASAVRAVRGHARKCGFKATFGNNSWGYVCCCRLSLIRIVLLLLLLLLLPMLFLYLLTIELSRCHCLHRFALIVRTVESCHYCSTQRANHKFSQSTTQ